MKNSNNYRTTILFYIVNFLFPQFIWIFFSLWNYWNFLIQISCFYITYRLASFAFLALTKIFYILYLRYIRSFESEAFWIISKINLREIFLSNIICYLFLSKVVIVCKSFENIFFEIPCNFNNSCTLNKKINIFVK